MILAWHFLKGPLPGILRDGSPAPADGEILRHEGALRLCESGLHASIRALDAADYALGPIVCRVECGGTIQHDDDKLVCTERRILWRADARETLRAFARRCALSVIHLWDPPAVVREYLETGREETRAAAWDAAWAAARDAAWDARDAARAAARAARAAAWDAAWAAARDAAWDAARDAARAAARAAMASARAAARDAAWDAALAAQNVDLESALMALAPGGKP